MNKQELETAKHLVEKNRNKILNLEDATARRFEDISMEIADKIKSMDELDDKLKAAAEIALSEGAIGQRVMEMMTGGLHAHDEKIGQIKSNLIIIGDQVLQTVTQLSGWEAKIDWLEKEVNEMASRI